MSEGANPKVNKKKNSLYRSPVDFPSPVKFFVKTAFLFCYGGYLRCLTTLSNYIKYRYSQQIKRLKLIIYKCVGTTEYVGHYSEKEINLTIDVLNSDQTTNNGKIRRTIGSNYVVAMDLGLIRV